MFVEYEPTFMIFSYFHLCQVMLLHQVEMLYFGGFLLLEDLKIWGKSTLKNSPNTKER